MVSGFVMQELCSYIKYAVQKGRVFFFFSPFGDFQHVDSVSD